MAFGPGLTVLTGETGAGKSILVDALGLLLGGRADADVHPRRLRRGRGGGRLRAHPGAGRAARGAGAAGPRARRWCCAGWWGAPGAARRTSTARWSRWACSARLMRGAVDIAGQHEHVGLFDAALHRALLDRYGGVGGALTAYRARLRGRWRHVQARMEALGGDEAAAAPSAPSSCASSWTRSSASSPVPGEEAALEEERRRLAGLERAAAPGCRGGGAPAAGEDRRARAGARGPGAGAASHEAAKLDASLAPAGARAWPAALAELEEADRRPRRATWRGAGGRSRRGSPRWTSGWIASSGCAASTRPTPLDGVLARREALERGALHAGQPAGGARPRWRPSGARRRRAARAQRRRPSPRARERVRRRTSTPRGARGARARWRWARPAFEVRVDAAAPCASPRAWTRWSSSSAPTPASRRGRWPRWPRGGEASRLLLALKRASWPARRLRLRRSWTRRTPA